MHVGTILYMYQRKVNKTKLVLCVGGFLTIVDEKMD